MVKISFVPFVSFFLFLFFVFCFGCSNAIRRPDCSYVAKMSTLASTTMIDDDDGDRSPPAGFRRRQNFDLLLQHGAILLNKKYVMMCFGHSARRLPCRRDI